MRKASKTFTRQGQSNALLYQSLRSSLMAGAASSLLFSIPAFANDAAFEDDSVKDIVVTGSRIVSDGYSAPTPVSVLGEADIAAQSPANISDFVNQLPAISGGATSGSSSGQLSNAAAGINSVGLRGLGVGRTLVLVNGQRSVASTVSGTVDVNTIPQDLVKRVEVITGGASAAYGSDAVGGVVNFILDTDYTGVKLGADTGISAAGDGHNYRFTASAGLSLMDDRLHLLSNVSYFKQNRVEQIRRKWNNSGYFQINNPFYDGVNGQPQRYVGSGIGPSGYTAGGLITTGPLRGTTFLGEGETGTLTFGTLAGSWMIGGDWQETLDGHVGTSTFTPMDERLSAFQRVAFDISSNIEIFGQFSYNRAISQSSYQQTPSTGVVIAADNAFLLSQYPEIASAMADQSLGSITVGTSNAGFPVPGSDIKREVYRMVMGATGTLEIGSRSLAWDIYYQKGVTKAHELITNSWNNSRLALAQDAVFDGQGNIVCRSTLANPSNGCVPLDRLGLEGPSSAALDYIFMGDFQPTRRQTLKQDVAAFTISGQAFTLSAGDISFATGAEWRREQINGEVDAAHNTGWLYGNFRVNKGKYDVVEGFLELDVPVFDDFNINSAARGTHYSSSGWVGTWKIGANWQALDSVRFRGNISRDIRAPNLDELFAAGTARSNTVIIPANSSSPVVGSQAFVQNLFGNRNLTPEAASSWTAGVVFSPDFLRGFSLSVDYYQIKIKDAIGTITAQQTVDLCYEQNISSYCPNVKFVDGQLSTIDLFPINFARQSAKGLDIEASYSFQAGPGKLRLHGQTTHYIENIVDNGISFPVDHAGVIGGGYASPDWVYRVSAFYDLDDVTFNIVARGFSDGVYATDYIECASNCPVSTPQYRTINNNQIKGATYVDASVNFKFPAAQGRGSLTFIVNNLLNKAPVLVGNGPDGNNIPASAQTSRARYDIIGRAYRVSAKLEF